MRHRFAMIALTGAVLLAACSGTDKTSGGQSAPAGAPAASTPVRRYAAVDGDRIMASETDGRDWLSTGRTYDEQRFSPLKLITADNVARLGLAWFADFDTRRGQESTPIEVDGVIYVTTAWSKLYAYEAKSGKLLWAYDPKVPGEWGVNACCDVVNRGVAVWNGKVYLGTIDARLVALDAGTGQVLWSVQVGDRDKPLSITGAPRVARGRVLIGEAGNEYEQRGFLSAYDAQTGALVWRWYVVPGDPAKGFENPQMAAAAKTWGGSWWKAGGGGGPWDAITYDPQTDLVLFGTGNGAPWADRDPQGTHDNLYISSIVALHLGTGEYAWHYQTTPHDRYDFDSTQQITVADLSIGGIKHHVAMQANKNGLFYVLDVATGQLLSARPFVPGVNWTSGVDMKTGRPVLSQAADYERTGKGFITSPGPFGAHNWHPMSFSPDTGLVYIPASQNDFGFVALKGDDNPMGQKWNVSMTAGTALYARAHRQPRNDGFVLAWDPVQAREAWRIPMGNSRSGGTLVTGSGLLFTGNPLAKEFAAYSARDGRPLWHTSAQTAVMAGAISYQVDDEQYVAVVAGGNASPGGGSDYYAPNYSRLLVYRLGGSAVLPPPVAPPARVLNPPPPFGTAGQLAHGAQLYDRFCGTCHGAEAQSRGMFPDVRYSGALQNAEAFRAIVLDGALKQNGMVSFKAALSPADAEDVRAYVVGRAIYSGTHAVSAAPAVH
ncbi:MAG TPA: PQQ-dependent dehydrogenase, methanol/ethanol family [Steroidobacteraceae bacterium]|nr:PQQ-dependent dehydrogenase, methanol/ethanol family [Steroidobacteraceae bacterium]